ncbi:APC family permease [Microbacterium sp. 18062]|uniref:APC family permease n=1 Tax=Microbacterium sp. 18062 TaxID=2681410 RepID=UPI001359FDE4|nr:APC family permease [Microbacterium sp. 18062]
MSAQSKSPKLIGTVTLALMVLAMAAPVGVVVGIVPLVIGYGNGIGAPGMFILVAVILATFSVGFAAMSRSVRTRGAFFAYIGAGLGERAGMAAGGVALGAYAILTIYVVAQFGYYLHNTLLELGIDVHWLALSLLCLLLVWLLSRRGTRESAVVTASILLSELFILLVLNIGVLIVRGPASYPLESFSPAEVFSGAPGFALALVFLSFIGFEVTAVFRDHVKNPDRTIGRATLLAVTLIGLVYALSAWSGIAGVGAEAVVAMTQGPNAGLLMFDVANDNVGAWAGVTLRVIMLVSVFATIIAVFNTSSQYVFNVASTFGTNPLGRVHAKYRSPANAGAALMIFSALVLGACALFGLDPYADVAALLGVLGAVGVIVVQVACVVAIFVHFRRRRDRRVWTTVLSPMVAGVAMLASLVIILSYYADLSGATSLIATWSPMLFVVIAGVGWILGKGRTLTPADDEKVVVEKI